MLTDFVGHSQGTINGNLAIGKLLLPAEQAQIQLFNVGTASWYMPSEVREFTNIVDKNDGVVNLAGGRLLNDQPQAVAHPGYRLVVTHIPPGNHNSHSFYLYAQQPEFQAALNFGPRSTSLLLTKPFDR